MKGMASPRTAVGNCSAAPCCGGTTSGGSSAGSKLESDMKDTLYFFAKHESKEEDRRLLRWCRSPRSLAFAAVLLAAAPFAAERPLLAHRARTFLPLILVRSHPNDAAPAVASSSKSIETRETRAATPRSTPCTSFAPPSAPSLALSRPLLRRLLCPSSDQTVLAFWQQLCSFAQDTTLGKPTLSQPLLASGASGRRTWAPAGGHKVR